MNFMDFELSDHDFWPSRDVVYEHFQANFHQTVLSKHVMLDATEVPYTEAKDFNAQRVALSTYTNTHTLKTMASVSASYGGSACARQIIKTHLTQR